MANYFGPLPLISVSSKSDVDGLDAVQQTILMHLQFVSDTYAKPAGNLP
jgi:hypothetical protein